MLKIIVTENPSLGLVGVYIPTKKNKLVENFYDVNGFLINSVMSGEKRYCIAKGPSPKYIIPILKVSDV
jgi:predicted enzyme involved in methoxymalonyl-ACP biosynthesis